MDLINREDAIDELHGKDPSQIWDTADIEVWLNSLPPAQPDVTDRNVGDCISRQDAIDALGDEPEVWTGRDEYAQGLNNQWHYDRNAILRCPSAQPRKGKWSKEMIGATPYKYRCSKCNKYSRAMYDFCPNCGADMMG